MRHAQIERLRALKKRIHAAWHSHNGVTEADAVLVDVEELVDILLMEKEVVDLNHVVPNLRDPAILR